MEFAAFFLDPAIREIGATGILITAVIGLFRGWIIPGSTHKRELEMSERARIAAETANKELLVQNSTLLAGVRIADKFYGDFLADPSRGVDENTQPRVGAPNVGT